MCDMFGRDSGAVNVRSQRVARCCALARTAGIPGCDSPKHRGLRALQLLIQKDHPTSFSPVNILTGRQAFARIIGCYDSRPISIPKNDVIFLVCFFVNPDC